MSISYLQRKRKTELLELAQQANLPDADRLLKDDLVDALANHLEANESTYGKKSAFSDFYARTGSPVKRERVSPTPVVVTKTRRRQTLKRAPSEEETALEQALATRTPQSVSRVASRVSDVQLPASPAQLAEVADQSFQAAKTKASELWERTRIEEAIEIIRENASSVVFIQLAVLLFEATSLSWNKANTVTAFDVPEAAAQRLGIQEVRVPDLTLLLTSDFWAPTTLWSLTSWVLPLLFSYFFNLTLQSNTRHRSPNKQYTVDPLTFNIARAILAYSAYSAPVVFSPLDQAQGAASVIAEVPHPGWGPFDGQTVRTVCDNILGKYNGLQIGSVIGILYSLYDAALKK